jgi:hypothetical protein
MSDKIFINYRRDDSIGMAGRLHDRLAQTFGRDRLFMDVDHIPVGADFVAHLNTQVAACEVVLVVIGRNWLRAKDKAGQRRLHQPDDFVAIEIAAALARDIRVIPVLVDGARMPKESELPDSLKPLARRQAVDVRHSHFGHDAEALVKRMREALGEEVPVAREREALGDEKAGPGRWRMRATIGAAAVAVLLLIGWGGYELILYMKADIEEAFRDVRQRAELDKQAALEAAVKAQQELQTKHQAEQAEQQRVAALKAEEDRRAKAAAEAEEKRKAEEAERQRLAKAEQERQAKAEQERQARAAAVEEDRRAKAAAGAEEKRRAEETERQRLAAVRAEEERRAKAAAGRFSITKDVAVKGYPYKIQNSGTIEGCSTQCAADERCVMFEYWDNNWEAVTSRFRTAAGDVGSCYLFDRNYITDQRSGAQVGVRTRPQ